MIDRPQKLEKHPHRPFHNSAPKFVSRQTLCSLETSIDGFWGSKLVKGSVGIADITTFIAPKHVVRKQHSEFVLQQIFGTREVLLSTPFFPWSLMLWCKFMLAVSDSKRGKLIGRMLIIIWIPTQNYSQLNWLALCYMNVRTMCTCKYIEYSMHLCILVSYRHTVKRQIHGCVEGGRRGWGLIISGSDRFPTFQSVCTREQLQTQQLLFDRRRRRWLLNWGFHVKIRNRVLTV